MYIGEKIYAIIINISIVDGILNSKLFNGIQRVISVNIALMVRIVLFLIFVYSNEDIIDIAMIVIIIRTMYGLFIPDNSMMDSINDETGMGTPINVFVGPVWCVMIVLYLLNLRIPQDIRSIVGIIISMLLYSIMIMSDGATPKDITSARESIVSPNISSVSDGYFLARGPSMASNTTASMSSAAVSIGF